jgi:AraC-like DNA-binding protein
VEIWLKTNDISFKRKDNAIYRVRKAMLLSIHQGEFDVERFAKKEKVSYDSLRKKFKQETGLSPHQYFLLIKLNRAKALLLRQNITVKQIASELGFEDPYYFSRLFTKKEGLSPDSYRKKKLTSILHANKFLDSNP